MKKIIAGMLAVMTAVSMTSVSFAKNSDSKDITVDVTTGLYTYDADSDTVTHVDGPIEPGEDVYIGVVANDIDGTVTVSDFDNYRIRASWDYGSKSVAKPEFTTIKVGSDRIAVIKIDGKYTTSTNPVDVVGELTIEGRSGAIVNGGNELKLPVDFTYSWEEIEGDGYIDGGVVYFDGLDDVTLEFDGGIEFSVDAKGQSDLFLKMNNDVSTALIDEYDFANLDFINFEGSKRTFNKTGTVYIPYELDKGTPHIYVRTSDGLVEIVNAYDKDEDAFIFKTKTLGNWVISDRALKIDADKPTAPDTSKPTTPTKPATPSTSTPSIDDGGKYNPDTGR